MGKLPVHGTLYRPLGQEQVETIHQAALEVLDQTGIGFEPGLEEEIRILTEAGARLDADRSRLMLPPDLVRQQVAKAPERVMLFSRDGRNDLDLFDHQVHLGTGGASVKILDLESGQARATTLQDLRELGRLVDSLDNIHFFLRPCIPTDIPQSNYDLNVFYTCFKATAKHVMAGVNDVQGLHSVLDLASTLADDRASLRDKPFFSLITSFIISPLKLSTQPVQIMLEAVRQGVPVALSGAPMAGSTSPLTMAGTLVQAHAEQLAGITLCQLINPGAPVLYGAIPSRADLMTMNYCGGAVECGMMNAAIHQLANHVRIPNYNSSGLSDAKIPDAQAGWEKGMTTLLTAMAGSNFIHHAAGMLESMLGVAYEQYVIDDEIIGQTCRVLRGIEVDQERLALEVIDQIGPGGEFMTSDHTFEHMYSEYYLGNGISDRSDRATWEARGCLDVRERARAKARDILAREPAWHIPAEKEAEIRKRFDILD
jgi:trimethylamine--corrinoid protein Co-methyltransferase